MYHPYEQGYNVLPGLYPLGHDFGNGDLDKKFFQLDDQFKLYQSIKYSAENMGQCCIGSDNQVDYTWQAREHVIEFMNRQLKEEYPDFNRENPTLDGLCFQIQEDVALYQAETDRLVYCHVHMPSGWCPCEKLGKSFRELHEPIPGMRLDKSEGLVRAMLNNGPFVRFVWGVVFENRLNFHPSRPKKPFDPNHPEVYVKVERQTTKGFPEHSIVLFLMRHYLLHLDELRLKPLIAALSGMTEEQRAYKGIDKNFDKLLEFLKSKV